MALVYQELSNFVWTRTSGFEKKYFQRIEYKCRNFEAHGLNNDTSLRLNHVFVPLRVESNSVSQVSPDMMHNLSEYESGENISYFLTKIKKNSAFQNLVILGSPGSGKTTLLRYVALAYATRRQKTLLDSHVPNFIPIIVALRDVRQEIIDNSRVSLVSLVLKSASEYKATEPLNAPPEWFLRRLRLGKCLVMLDGLDEVANFREREIVSRWVDQQMRNYPDSPFILTSRPFGYKSVNLKQRVTVLEVKPFTLDQIQEFIHKWYLLTELKYQSKDDSGIKSEAREKADDLIKRVLNKAPLSTMATNPLLLTMISTVHRNGNALPGRRVELYREICQVMLEKRQSAKHIYDSFSATAKQSVLQPLALTLMMKGKSDFKMSQIETFLKERLAKVLRHPINPEDFIAQIRDVSALIMEKDIGEYEFSHLSLQEYLASVAIKEMGQENILINVIKGHKGISWWAETIRLYAAQSDATRIIQTALNERTVETLSLAYSCLEECKSVDIFVRQEVENILERSLEAR